MASLIKGESLECDSWSGYVAAEFFDFVSLIAGHRNSGVEREPRVGGDQALLGVVIIFRHGLERESFFALVGPDCDKGSQRKDI